MPTILESELEDFLFDVNNIEYVVNNLSGNDNVFRQLDIGTGYGRADLVVVSVRKEKTASITVIELKKDSIGCDALMQASKYLSGIKEYFNLHLKDYEIIYGIILVGGALELNSDFVYMASLVENLRLYTYSLSLSEGISFDEIYPESYSPTKNTFGKALEDFSKFIQDSTAKIEKIEAPKDA